MLKTFIGKIQYYHWCFVSRKYFRNLSNPYVYLEPGRYNVVCYHRMYLVKEGLSGETLRLIGVEGDRPYFPGFKVTREESKSKLFCAQLIMSAHGGQRYFNFTNGETFRMFSDINEYETYNKGVTTFKHYFNCTDLHYTKHYSVERIVNNKPRESWSCSETKEIFKIVFSNYTRYLESANKKEIEISEYVDSKQSECKEYNKLVKELREFINRKPLSLPFVLCHCDLHFGNTLIDGDNIYLIDFENVREDVFFYDLFNILFVEYVDNDNPYFIEEYFTDNSEVYYLYQRAFQAVGIELEKKNRVLYFTVFLLSRLIHNVSYLENHYTREMANRPILDTVKSIKKAFDYITVHEE